MNDPAIPIAGRIWRIPPLAPRQNRIVLPALMSLGERPERRYDVLLDIVFAALTRADPALDRGDFEDWPVATFELLDALPAIARQTGFLRTVQGPVRAETPTRLPDWDAIIAQFVNFLPGTTPDYWEDALTAARLDAMHQEWRRHPPVAMLISGWLGYRPKPRDADAIEELMRLFPSGRLRLN